jgi:hypothetical protein
MERWAELWEELLGFWLEKRKRHNRCVQRYRAALKPYQEALEGALAALKKAEEIELAKLTVDEVTLEEQYSRKVMEAVGAPEEIWKEGIWEESWEGNATRKEALAVLERHGVAYLTLPATGHPPN